MSYHQRMSLALSIAMVLGLGWGTRSAAAAPIPEVAWERLDDGPDLALHSMILDTANDMLWIFGGITADPCGNDFHNEVWRLDLAQDDARWVLARVDGLRPPPLIFHSAVYDPTRQEMIVYGGLVQQRSCRSGDVNDPKNLWRLDISDPDAVSWTRESVPGNLAARYGHAAVYLPSFDAMVVSGGVDANDEPRNDNWAVQLGETPPRWVRLANAGFANRAGHGLILDASGERLLAYGGLDRNDRAQNLLDALDVSGEIDDADRWLRVRPENPSPQRSFFAHAFDAERQLWWMQGGFLAGNRFARDLQVLDLSGEAPVWTNTQTVYNGPLDRFFHVGVWDAVRRRMIVHGGTPDNNRTLKDTRAMVYQGLVPDPPTATTTSTATATATASATATPSATADVALTATASATTDASTATATASPTSSPTPPDTTATASPTTAATPSPTTGVPPGPARIHLPFAMSNAAPDGAGRATTTPPPTATVVAQARLEVSSAFGGNLERLAVAGDRVYAGVGLSLRVIDISDPAAPREVGRIEGLPAQVRRIAVDGDRLAVGTDVTTLLYDLSDPDRPLLRGRVDLLAAPNALAFHGRVLLGSAAGRLRVLDVADLSQAEPLATLNGFSAVDLVVADTRLVAVTQGELRIVDVEEPADPVILGSVALPSRAYAIDAVGSLAAVALDREGLLLVDLSDPSAPTARGALDTPGRAIDLDLDGDRLWVADSFGYVSVRVSDRDAPVILGETPTEGFAFEVEVHESLVLAADAHAGLRIFDAATAAAPAELGAFDVAGRATVMDASGNLAVVLHINDALRFVGIADPAAPAQLAALPEYAKASGLTLDGERLYVAMSGQLVILDVSDPASPSQIGSLSIPGNLNAVAIAGTLAFVADLFAGLHVIDVSDPSAPVLLSTLPVEGGRAAQVATDPDRGLVFVAAEDAGLLVVDVADPSNPTLRASLATDRASALQRIGNRLYLAAGTGLLVVDIDDPDAPRARGASDARGAAYALDVVGDRAWLAHGGGVSVFDVADPDALALVAEIRPGARQFGIRAAGDRAAVAGDAGLLMLEIVLP